MRVGFDAEPILDQREVGVVLAQEAWEKAVVVEGHDDARLALLPLAAIAAGHGRPTKCRQ